MDYHISKQIVISYYSSSEEEAVLVHIEFASHLQDFGTHLEAEEQFVYFKQTTACVPVEDMHTCTHYSTSKEYLYVH